MGTKTIKKLAVVTGGTKGIGKAMIRAFAAADFDVATCARNQQDLDLLQKEISDEFGNEVFVKQADLSKTSDVHEFVQFINKLQRNPHVLVNNTGSFLPGQIQNEEPGVFEMMMATNISSAYHITRGFLPGMIANNQGHIFNICSTASITAYTNGGSYCISKFAMYGMGKVLREELKHTGIRVTNILPGATLTASWEGVDLPKERFVDPADVASAVLNAYLLSDHSVVEELVIRPQLGDI